MPCISSCQLRVSVLSVVSINFHPFLPRQSPPSDHPQIIRHTSTTPGQTSQSLAVNTTNRIRVKEDAMNRSEMNVALSYYYLSSYMHTHAPNRFQFLLVIHRPLPHSAASTPPQTTLEERQKQQRSIESDRCLSIFPRFEYNWP